MSVSCVLCTPPPFIPLLLIVSVHGVHGTRSKRSQSYSGREKRGGGAMNHVYVNSVCIPD